MVIKLTRGVSELEPKPQLLSTSFSMRGLVLAASVGIAAAWSPAAGLRLSQSRVGAVSMGYIEESDEPWHATCVPTTVPNKAVLE